MWQFTQSTYKPKYVTTDQVLGDRLFNCRMKDPWLVLGDKQLRTSRQVKS
jgi:hypothetical protein